MFGLRKSPRTDSNTALGIELSESGFSVSALNLNDAKPHLHWCEWIDASQIGSSQERMEALVDRRGLDGLKAIVVLPATDYQLHRLPKPAVPDAELRQALRWQLRDLVEFPLAEAIVDVFPVQPEKVQSEKTSCDAWKSSNTSREPAYDDKVGEEVFVVVARQQRLETHINTLRSAGLEISAIEIPELALARLHGQLDELLPDSKASISALLHLTDGQGLLAVCEQQALLMARELHAETIRPREQSFDLTFDGRPGPEIPGSGITSPAIQQPSKSAARIASALQFFDDGANSSARHLWHLPTVSANDWWPEVVAGAGMESGALAKLSLQPFDFSRLMTGAGNIDLQLQSRCLLSTAAAFRTQGL